MLAILSLVAALAAGGADRSPREQVLTPESPSYPAACVAASVADRSRLTEPVGRDDRLWICSLLCSTPMTVSRTTGLLVEREDEEPLLFLDLDESGQFSQDERFVLSRRNDVILKLPLRESPYAHYPLAIRYSWKHLKPRGGPERRILLQSAFAFAAGDVRAAEEEPGRMTSRQPRPRF
jgi:hypothetical protein